ncbi:3-hydroxyacyl-CoA dehydrogenase NAD-binding domain-containing protein [Actinoalloteichus caeruleus]|uniref:3-hydroxybutyryl-CoA dehydrogenase n=1 Tax=Actinoalloteichus caeruleus DSM 43889 TaxID=1120930 RepID=A0ABT1JFQ2_ACTCY|nr:3-hydroxyacyl-CoA dehydrogenase NAD-binding domain-containing protein [Actinoalloteichus caeruleus]MCP2331003.1 3-hydroxybutyryl-CoA dehydrogenase [Actinoalloteichus caeruleus DSM 43889]
MRVRVVGAGVMGRGIAQWAATAGHTVELADARPAAVGEAVEFTRSMLGRAVERGRLSAEQGAAAGALLVPLDSPWEPGPEVDLVVEAVREDLATKVEVFTRLAEVLPAHTVFTSNTSSIPITRIAASLADPSRLAGLHFFNPVPLMRLVEVVPGARTRPEIPGLLAEFVRGCGHRPVVVADTPGFLVNHAGRGLVTEALALVEEATAGVPTLDAIARDVLGLRMGPFELMDLTGLDVTDAVIDSVWQGFRCSDRLRPSFLTPNRVAAGLHGRKTGEGFYSYGDPGPSRAAEPPVVGDRGRVFRVAGSGVDATALRNRLVAVGGRFVDNPAVAAEGTPVLVPTWGTTVAALVAEHRLPPAGTVGVDPLSLAPGSGRIVLAATPAVDGTVVADARAVLAGPGGDPEERVVSVVRDTAGSVAQRLVASIVGVAASIAERDLASPEDVDLAVSLALGYPHGPLSWGDRIGARRLLALQTALFVTTGDPRYRPTRWVTERAQLGLPLTTPASGHHD